MTKNKKDYLSKTLLLQFLVCLVLFGGLFSLKSTSNKLFTEIENVFFSRLEENLSVDEVKAVFSNVDDYKNNNTGGASSSKSESESEFTPFEEPSLSAEIIASGGRDIKVSSSYDIPENVSINDYTLSQKITLPLEGKTTSKFGVRIHPISGDLRFHAGIDIAANTGENIYSAFDGRVVAAGYDEWNGNYLKIKHDNNIMTVYCHCEALNVKKGQQIRAGEVIATVGSTGSSTGPHLHFELRIENVSYNPEIAFKEAVNAV